MTPPDGRRRTVRDRLIALVFGDRLGLCLFLLAGLFLGFTWRVGFFILDSRTVANLAANVADGRLAVVEMPYSLTATAQPGLVELGGHYFGRNYGQVYLAVPFVWTIEVLDGLVSLRLLLAGTWSLGLVALGRTGAAVLDRPRIATVGALAGVATTAIAALTLAPMDHFDEPAALVGLQVATIVVAALGATVLYRLLRTVDGPEVAVAGGLGLVVATPFGFWGTIPKRHVFTGTILAITCLCFAAATRSRGRRRTLARAGAYGAIGYLASIHAFEAAFMFVVLVPVDLAVHRRESIRAHGIVVAVFLLALLPMLATNLAIAGDPFGVPRTLPDATAGTTATPEGGVTPESVGGSDGGAGGSGGGSADPVGSAPNAILSPVIGALATVLWIGRYMLDTVDAGLATLHRPGALYHTFVRSGWVPGIRYGVNGWEAVELALFEAFPLAAGLVALPVVVGAGLRDRWRRWTLEPVDGLALAMATVFVLIYLPRLPLHSMITLRYLAPAVPLLLYLVCRLPPVRTAVSAAPRTVAAAYLATVVVGGVILVVAFWLLDPATGEAIQLHGLIGLAGASVTVVAVGSGPFRASPGVSGAVLGAVAGTTSVFLCSAALWQFQYAPYALAVAELVAASLPTIG